MISCLRPLEDAAIGAHVLVWVLVLHMSDEVFPASETDTTNLARIS
jgi:hypothetical protein